MSSSELWDKFNDCASRALPREQIAPLFERLETFESDRALTEAYAERLPAWRELYRPRH